MRILARIITRDLAVRGRERESSFSVEARMTEDAVFEGDTSLDAKILRAMHTYTDGEGLWIDFKDNGDLLKIVRSTGKFCEFI